MASPLPRLGPREATVMAVLWGAPDRLLQVREVRERLGEDLAYTTVMTLLVRLHAKGLLTRRRRGRAWAYRPKISRSEYAALGMVHALHGATDPPTTFFQFVEQLSEDEQVALRAVLDEQ